MLGPGYTLRMSTCLFYVLLTLAFSLSVFDVADEDKKNKAFPICALIINSLVIFVIMLQIFGVKLIDMQQYGLAVFVIVLILSFSLSVENVADNDQENKSLPTLVLVFNSFIMLLMLFTMVKKYIK